MSQLVGSDIGKCLNLRVSPPFDWNQCVLLHLYSCVFIHGFLTVDWLHRCYSQFSILNGWEPMFSDKFSGIDSVCILSFFIHYLHSPFESSRGYLQHNGLWIENIKTDVFRFGVDSAHSFHCSLFSGQVSGPSLVSFSALICILACGRQSEYSANFFYISFHFCTIGFGVYEIAYS